MNPKQIQEGHLDVCERLGDHPVFAESWLSAAGDVRWKSGHMVEFQHLVESRARRMLRNRKSGLRPAEEYGVPLVGPEKLSSAGVPELVHTKAAVRNDHTSNPLHQQDWGAGGVRAASNTDRSIIDDLDNALSLYV